MPETAPPNRRSRREALSGAHPIRLLWRVSAVFRSSPSFTVTALDLCVELGRQRLDQQVARNAFALLGGGVGAA